MTSERKEFNYDSIGDTYATGVDASPYNALYERPAMLALLPGVAGSRILDAGCGGGWYSEQLLHRGADVDAVDGSGVMVDHARTRLADKVSEGDDARLTIQHADLAQPLPFPDARFDGIVCPLVLHYIADWRPTLKEFRRVMKPEGWLLFSTHHPGTEMARYAPDNYFAVELIAETWDWLGEVKFYRRPLTEISAALSDADFIIDRIVEPVPTEEFRAINPDSYMELIRQPAFMIVLARPRASGA